MGKEFVLRKLISAEDLFKLVCETEETGYLEGDFLDDYEHKIGGWWNHNSDRMDKWCLEIAEEFLSCHPDYRPTNKEVIAYALQSHIEWWMEEENERCSYDNAE